MGRQSRRDPGFFQSDQVLAGLVVIRFLLSGAPSFHQDMVKLEVL